MGSLPGLGPGTSTATLSSPLGREGDLTTSVSRYTLRIKDLESYPIVHDTSCSQYNHFSALQVGESQLLLLCSSSTSYSSQVWYRRTSFVPTRYQQGKPRVYPSLFWSHWLVSPSEEPATYHKHAKKHTHGNHLFPCLDDIDSMRASSLSNDRKTWNVRVYDGEPTRLIRPKAKVTNEKNIRGPTRRTAMVAGSWKHTPDTVKMRIEMEKRLPWFSPRSLCMLVTEALEIRPLSRRLRLHSKPAMVQSLMSTFRMSFLSCLSPSPTAGLLLLDIAESSVPLSDTYRQAEWGSERMIIVDRTIGWEQQLGADTKGKAKRPLVMGQLTTI